MSATLEPSSHAPDHHDDHGHGHAHMPFQAHHFDDPEQQFDSGKLGMWLFLVTEVLFFSGMFCAYAMYRSLHPEVFEFASRFLNEKLGAFNTGVLLFSSLTMAWGVRCAQLRQRTGLVICLAITLGCASIFLGVKAIEYSHKWDIGLLPAGLYQPQYAQEAHHAEGISQWLVYFSIVPALCAVGFAAWYAWALARKDKATAEIAGPFLATALCFFAGVGIGMYFQAQEDAEAAALAAANGHGHAAHSHGDATHGDATHGDAAHGDAHAPATSAASLPVQATFAPDFQPGQTTEMDVDQKGRAGLFFSIYYCMTGVHAIHIIGGMLVLGWLLIRATKDHFNEQYFGPVDYVGLYWHLVDLIWIYLFPLLYLIK